MGHTHFRFSFDLTNHPGSLSSTKKPRVRIVGNFKKVEIVLQKEGHLTRELFMNLSFRIKKGSSNGVVGAHKPRAARDEDAFAEGEREVLGEAR